MNSYKNWARVQKRQGDFVTQMMRSGDSCNVQHQKQTYHVYRVDSQYLVMQGGTRLANPHPAIVRKAKTILDKEAVLDVMES